MGAPTSTSRSVARQAAIRIISAALACSDEISQRARVGIFSDVYVPAEYGVQ